MNAAAATRSGAGNVPDSGPALRLVIADDSVLVREGITRALGSRGFDVVAQASSGDELLELVASCHPDVAIVDIRMPPTGTDEGLRVARLIGERHADVGVLVLSDYLVPEYARRLLEPGNPGQGYLLKQTISDLDRFAAEIRRVAEGESVVDPAIVRRLLSRHREPDPLAALSSRELDVLALMAEGNSNRAIAQQLVLSERTIESHVSSIFQKLDLVDTPDNHRRVRAVLAFLRK